MLVLTLLVPDVTEWGYICCNMQPYSVAQCDIEVCGLVCDAVCCLLMKQEDETLDKAADIMREWRQTLPGRL